jgi:DNA (cytosine-5)-methyltransferase 1
MTFVPDTAPTLLGGDNATGGTRPPGSTVDNCDSLVAHPPAIAFSCKDHGADAGDVAPTLRSMEYDESHANGGGQIAVVEPVALDWQAGGGNDESFRGKSRQYIVRPPGAAGTVNSSRVDAVAIPAIAFTERGREAGRSLEYQEETAYCLLNPGAGSRTQERQVIDTQLQVRRLTPKECERLQGLPDGWTLVPYRAKPAADGPRYKAIGNGWCRPVFEWVFGRLTMCAEILEGEDG